jgi:peptidoglycan/LPS O-acetylase OafA/YrhL
MHGNASGPRRALVRDLRGPSRLAALDGVRGMAVVVVVVWHLYRVLASSAGFDSLHVPAVWWPLGTARLGVDVFFVLSGFFVVRSWRATRERSGSFVASSRDFVRRRAARILPAYWASLLVLVPLVAPELFRRPRQLLLFATVNQYVVRDLPDKLNPVLWSLTTEWHFYLLVPLVAFLLRRIGRWWVLGACIGVTVLWCSHVPPLGLPAGSLFGRLDQFVAGAIAADLVDRVRRGEHTWLTRALATRVTGIVAVAGVVAIGTYHGSTMGVPRGNAFDPFLHPLVGLLVAAGLVALCTSARRGRSVFDAKPLRLAGLVSYSLYLWHVPILVHGLRWAGVEAPFGPRDAVVIAFALAACVAVAVLSYAFVERPFLQHRRQPVAEPVRIIGQGATRRVEEDERVPVRAAAS